MNIEFVKGITGTDDILGDTRRQVAFVGRSNVGKSSVINTLVGQKIARPSSTPGKTRELNFFLVNKKVYFVDLPGYGYAKLSQKAREKLRKHIVWYLFESEAPLSHVVIIFDAQVGLKDFDREVIRELYKQQIEAVLVANKSDKLTQKKRSALEKKLREEGVRDEELVWFSAKTGKGKGELLGRIL
jgi:GTP-binding protein